MPDQIDLSTLNVMQLKKHAKELGIAIPADVTTKPGLIELIGQVPPAPTIPSEDFLKSVKIAIEGNADANKELENLLSEFDSAIEAKDAEIAALKGEIAQKEADLKLLLDSNAQIEGLNQATVKNELLTPEIVTDLKKMATDGKVAELIEHVDEEGKKTYSWQGEKNWPVFLGGAMLGLVAGLDWKLIRAFDAPANHCIVFVREDAYALPA